MRLVFYVLLYPVLIILGILSFLACIPMYFSVKAGTWAKHSGKERLVGFCSYVYAFFGVLFAILVLPFALFFHDQTYADPSLAN